MSRTGAEIKVFAAACILSLLGLVHVAESEPDKREADRHDAVCKGTPGNLLDGGRQPRRPAEEAGDYYARF